MKEQGSVLMIAVVAMLVLGTLAVACALLARVETAHGVDTMQQLQAEALAEAGLEAGRNAARAAATAPTGFSAWIGALLVDGAGLGPGRYWVRLDNDCAGLVPPAIEEVGCPTDTDANQAAVITSWAEAGTGRARARALVTVDSPWRHVCSGAKGDDGGYCNDPRGRNGNPVVTPADRADPNGPAAYDDLPRPVLGCSTIDPTAHFDGGSCTRLVVTGEDPRVTPGASVCYDDGPVNAGRYFGYFDCALQTPCPAGVCSPGTVVRGCVRSNDSRLSDPAKWSSYREVGPGCHLPFPGSVTGMPDPATGLVFNYPGATASLRNPMFDGTTLGSPAQGVTIYVLRNGSDGQVTVGPQATAIHGTLVIEGNGRTGVDPCSATDADIRIAGTATLAGQAGAYGHPLALLLYDPTQAAPTVSPYVPQSVCAALDGTDLAIRGVVYTAGHLKSGAVRVEGSIVAFEVQSEPTSQYAYRATGGLLRPPGFPGAEGSRVSMTRKSVVHCGTYHDERGGATSCP